MPSSFESIRLKGGPIEGLRKVWAGTANKPDLLVPYNTVSGKDYLGAEPTALIGATNQSQWVLLEYEAIDDKRPWLRARRYRYRGTYNAVTKTCGVHGKHVVTGKSVPAIDHRPTCSLEDAYVPRETPTTYLDKYSAQDYPDEWWDAYRQLQAEVDSSAAIPYDAEPQLRQGEGIRLLRRLEELRDMEADLRFLRMLRLHALLRQILNEWMDLDPEEISVPGLQVFCKKTP